MGFVPFCAIFHCRSPEASGDPPQGPSTDCSGAARGKGPAGDVALEKLGGSTKGVALAKRPS